jgi:preprotein translocase subunit SecG
MKGSRQNKNDTSRYSNNNFKSDEEDGIAAGSGGPANSTDDDDDGPVGASIFQRRKYMTKSSRVIQFKDGSFKHVPLLYSTRTKSQDKADEDEDESCGNDDDEQDVLSHSTRSVNSTRSRSLSYDGWCGSHNSLATMLEEEPPSLNENKDIFLRHYTTPLETPLKSNVTRKKTNDNRRKSHKRAASENVYHNALNLTTASNSHLRSERTPLLPESNQQDPPHPLSYSNTKHGLSRSLTPDRREHHVRSLTPDRREHHVRSRSTCRASSLILENMPYRALHRSKIDDLVSRREEERLIRIAACFLMDFEESRPATLVPDPDLVSWRHLYLHQFRFSRFWQTTLLLSAISLVGSSYFDYSPHVSEDQYHGPVTGLDVNDLILMRMTVFSTVIFLVDVIFVVLLQDPASNKSQKNKYGQPVKGEKKRSASQGQVPPIAEDEASVGTITPSILTKSPRQSRAKWWAIPLLLFLMALNAETVCETVVSRKEIVWAGMFKPIAFFYLFQQARDALEALRRISYQMINVLFMELFLIFIFSAIARELYGDLDEEQFGTLSTSFISMFKLSTTVVNPSLWMPIYNESRPSAIFFVCFLITTIFYFHSLVLSVVFNSYMQAMSKIRERYSTDREDNIRLAFRALHRFDRFRRGTNFAHGGGNITSALVPLDTIKKVLQRIRYHYDQRKVREAFGKYEHYTCMPAKISLSTLLSCFATSFRTPILFYLMYRLMR